MRRTATHPSRLVTILASLGLVALLASSAAASQIGFVYALRDVPNGANQIYGFRFDPGSGALTLLPGFPVASGGTGTGAAASEQLVHVDGRLYVLNDGDDRLTAFSVNRTTGALTALPFSPVALGAGGWACVAVHASGSPVVIGNYLGGISSFVVSATTATAAPGSPFTTGSSYPSSCRFSPDGNYVYTGGGLGTGIAGFSVNAGTGVLTALAGSPFDSGGQLPRGYVIDSSGRLFSATSMQGRVRAFTTAAGLPTAVTGNPFVSGLTRGVHAVLHPGGFYMVADQFGDRVGVYQIAGTDAGTTLSAVTGSPFAAGGTFTEALALTPNGAHLLAANGNSRNLTVFQVNQSTGALTTAVVQPANTLGTSGIVNGLAFVAAEAGFVYALQTVNASANLIHGFRINPSTGALTALSGFPIDSGGTGFGGFSEQIKYLNGRVYVVNEGSDTLTAFKVNRTTGALTALAFSPIALNLIGGWTCVAIHPSGSPVVVGGGHGLVSINVTATTATGSHFATGSVSPISCEFSRNGNYLYAGGSDLGTKFVGFSVDAGTGVLTPLAGSPFESGNTSPNAFATDSSGRLFLANRGVQQVRAFTTSAGVPTGVSGNPFASGIFLGSHGVLHPSGFYMVADRNGDRVAVSRIGGDGAATTLAAVAGSPFASGGSQTNALALTEDGAFLVAANNASRNLTVFQVNPATGGLTSLGTQAANTLGATGSIGGVTFAAVVPPFIDDPLTALSSVIKAAHITELRTRIDAVRAQYGLGPYTYTDATLSVGTTVVRAVHVTELRAALGEAYTALAMAQPSYTDPGLTIGSTVVKLAHIAELRAAVIAIE